MNIRLLKTAAEAAAMLLRDIDKAEGLCQGGEQYPNGLNCAEAIRAIEKALKAEPATDEEVISGLHRELAEVKEERDAALMRVGRHITVADPESASYKIGFHNGAHQMRRDLLSIMRDELTAMDRHHIEPN